MNKRQMKKFKKKLYYHRYDNYRLAIVILYGITTSSSNKVKRAYIQYRKRLQEIYDYMIKFSDNCIDTMDKSTIYPGCMICTPISPKLNTITNGEFTPYFNPKKLTVSECNEEIRKNIKLNAEIL